MEKIEKRNQTTTIHMNMTTEHNCITLSCVQKVQNILSSKTKYIIKPNTEQEEEED
jgi:hypothetical protein